MADPVLTKKDTGPFKETDTDLGKFSHGNFDVEYMPQAGKLLITFRAKYEFQSGIPLNQQAEMKAGMLDAIDIWSHSGVFLRTRSVEALNEIIDIRFRLVETNDYNKIVDVYRDHMRPYVFRDVNISIDFRFDVDTLAHELGHVFGNYDEYGGSGISGWFERLMWWHDNNHLDDHQGMMNSGQKEFRIRYFDHFQSFVNDHFEDLGIRYDLVQGARVSRRRRRVRTELDLRDVAYGYAPAYTGPKRTPGPAGL